MFKIHVYKYSAFYCKQYGFAGTLCICIVVTRIHMIVYFYRHSPAMSYLHHNRGSEDINKWLAEHQTGSNTNRITQHAFGSSYHPSRTTKATATYGQRDAPPMSSATSRLTVNITSPTGGSGASSPSLYRSGGIATQSGGATKSKMNLSPSNPPDNDRSSSPFSTRDNDRFYGSTIGQTEDPRTELRKYIDLLKEIQKIDIDKCEMKYKQAMESFDVDTLTKEVCLLSDMYKELLIK